MIVSTLIVSIMGVATGLIYGLSFLIQEKKVRTSYQTKKRPSFFYLFTLLRIGILSTSFILALQWGTGNFILFLLFFWFTWWMLLLHTTRRAP